eukprot:scaffold11.g3906.t1
MINFALPHRPSATINSNSSEHCVSPSDRPQPTNGAMSRARLARGVLGQLARGAGVGAPRWDSSLAPQASVVSRNLLLDTMDMTVLEQEARIAGFRAEVLKSQELQVATFTRDTERLQSNLEKVRSEIRYEIDKLTASQRLDLNLEKGRMRDELQARSKAAVCARARVGGECVWVAGAHVRRAGVDAGMLRDKANELEIKMDKEVNSLKAAMEQSKNDTVKYVLGLMMALLTAGLGAARLLI